MATMQEIEKLMERLGAVRDALAGTALARDEDVAAAEKKYTARIRELTARFQAAGDAVVAAVKESPELFKDKRSVVLHGIAAGWRKAVGKIDWEDDERVVELIERHFPDQVDELLKVVKTPVKDALSELSVSDLKKLGIAVQDAGDAPYARLAEKETGRLIRALLRREAAAARKGAKS